MAKRKTRSKYHVDISAKGKKDRTYNGVTYDSLTEMRFMQEFVEPKIASGEVIKCERQVEYILQDGFTYNGKKILPIKYRSDFDLTYKDNKIISYDVKGNPDSLSLLKRKMYWNRYPEKQLTFICRNLKYGGWVPYDELKKLRREAKKKASD